MLEPEHPFFVADRIVSRSGVLVRRYFRYTRSSDGTIFVWLARKSEQGRGTGWSGLRFDWYVISKRQPLRSKPEDFR